MPGFKNFLTNIINSFSYFLRPTRKWTCEKINLVLSLPDEKMLVPMFIGTWLLLLVVGVQTMFGLIGLTNLRTDIPAYSAENEKYTYPGCSEPDESGKQIVIGSEQSEKQSKKSNSVTNEKLKCQQELSTFIKDKRDLNAQEGMWKAAVYLVGFTAFQTLFGIVGLIFIYRTLSATRATLVQTGFAATAAQESAAAEMKAQKAHVLPMLSANFRGANSANNGIETLTSRKRFVDISIAVKNFGNTPVRGGTVTSRKTIENASEIKKHFKALSSGQESDELRVIEFETMQLFTNQANINEVLTVIEFIDIDGDPSDIIAAWGDIKFIDKNGRSISIGKIRGMDATQALLAIDSVDVVVSYVEPKEN